MHEGHRTADGAGQGFSQQVPGLNWSGPGWAWAQTLASAEKTSRPSAPENSLKANDVTNASSRISAFLTSLSERVQSPLFEHADRMVPLFAVTMAFVAPVPLINAPRPRTAAIAMMQQDPQQSLRLRTRTAMPPRSVTG